MEQQVFTNGVPVAIGLLLGTERLPADLAAGGSESISSQQIADLTISQIETLPNGQYSADGHTASFTATVGQVAGARLVVLELDGALTGGATLTLPTAAQIVTGVPKAVEGETYTLRFVNDSSGAFSWTIAGNASVTVDGTATVAQGTHRDFLVTLVSLAAVVLQNIGSGGN